MIFKPILMVNGWGVSCETALRLMSLGLTYDKSTLVQVMAWCRQTPSHFLSQCWLRSLSLFGVTRPQRVNEYIYNDLITFFKMADKSLYNFKSSRCYSCCDQPVNKSCFSLDVLYTEVEVHTVHYTCRFVVNDNQEHFYVWHTWSKWHKYLW